MSTGLIDDLNDNVTNLDNPTDLNLIPSRSPLFHCPKCRKTFASRFGCGVHDSYCKEKHDHQLVELDVETMAVALEWFHSQEHDRFFCKESCRPSLRIFRCSQRTKKTSRVVKHTKKIYDCSAKIIFRQATLCQCEDTTTEICRNEKPRVLIYGCLSHCHPIERKNIRLSKVTKDHALNLLQSGLRHGVIIEKYFAPINDEPDHKLVVPADLYRIEKTANLHDHNLSFYLSLNRNEAFDESASKAWTYFVNNYGPEGRQAPLGAWARPSTLGAPSHNLNIERYHRTIKGVFKPNMNIGRFCLGLEKVDQIFIRKELMVKEGMRNIGYSKFQTDYSICHQVEEEMLKYKVEQKFQGFEVVRKGPDGAKIARYRMMRNRFECNKQLCL
ncbi:hypothetical protein TCAL_13071, partial [Tigriopus californicus]